MANVVLKNNAGTPIIYPGVDKIVLKDTDDQNVEFKLDRPDQNKTVDPTTSTQEIVADTGYELAKVTVNAIQTETKTVTANGSYTPTSGKFISSFTVAIPEYNGEVE